MKTAFQFVFYLFYLRGDIKKLTFWFYIDNIFPLVMEGFSKLTATVEAKASVKKIQTKV